MMVYPRKRSAVGLIYTLTQAKMSHFTPFDRAQKDQVPCKNCYTIICTMMTFLYQATKLGTIDGNSSMLATPRSSGYDSETWRIKETRRA